MKKQKTWENLEVGDVLVNPHNKSDKRIVLDFSLNKNFVYTNSDIISNGITQWPKNELIYSGLTIVQDKEEEVNKEEDLKKLIEETKQNIYNLVYEDDIDIDDLKDLLAKWKGVEVEKIKYIK